MWIRSWRTVIRKGTEIHMKSGQLNKFGCKVGLLTASVRRNVLRNKKTLVRQIAVQKGPSVEGGDF